MKKIVVKECDEGIRIDKYLSDSKECISRSTSQRLIEEGKITVNLNKIKTSYKLRVNDVIEIQDEVVKECVKLEPQELPLNIIYEDKDIIVINKAKGMVVHPGNGNMDGTLANAVMAHCKGSLSGIGGEIRPGIVHRLDKDTSGIIIVAKNDEAHINLSNQIKERLVKKTYIALVRGVIHENEAKINMPISRNTQERVKMAVSLKGKEAITNFKVLNRFDKYTLLEVQIETGRTHQIRVHLSEIGYPVVGDEVYSNGKNEFGVKGQCLHAYRLEFVHPITGKQMKLEAELPEYFEEIINKLK